jgi:hypothetical protein
MIRDMARLPQLERDSMYRLLGLMAGASNPRAVYLVGKSQQLTERFNYNDNRAKLGEIATLAQANA